MSESTKMVITSNRVYDTLKYLAQIVLPALGALYFGLSQIWGFPAGEEVVGTIVLFETFLGVLLGVNSAAYNKSDARFDGTLDVYEDDDTKRFLLNVETDPYEMEKQGEVLFKVKHV